MAHLATFHEQEYQPQLQETAQILEENEVAEIINENSLSRPKKENKKWIHAVKNVLTCGGHNKSKVPIIEGEERKLEIEIPQSASADLSLNGFKIMKTKAPNDANIMKDTNLIVQRVIDSNPLLEAFGNAKTCLNDNSSRFSRYSKLQFHVEDGLINPIAHIAGSTCHTFLLEKSRVVTHDSNNDERTFHIFYQLMQAPEEEKERIWPGLLGKNGSFFKYIGDGGVLDEYTNVEAWKNTISALNTIGT